MKFCLHILLLCYFSNYAQTSNNKLEYQKTIYSLGVINKILDNGNHNAFPCIVSTRQKNLIIGYRSSHGHLESNASANIILSDNLGKNWADEQVIDNGLDFRNSKYGIRSVNITLLKNKNLIATYHYNNGDFGGLYYKISKDNGNNWSLRKEILFTNYKTNKISCEGHIIETKGNYILPVFEGDKNDSLNVGVAISKDLNTWNFVKLPNQDGKELENIIVKITEDILLMFYSDPLKRKLFRSVSKNGGLAWSPPKDVTFKEWIVHRPNIYFDTKTKAMLLVYREGSKQSGALAISYDKGVTWKKLCSINNDGRRITYGDFITLSKNKIGFVFASERKSNGVNSNLYFVEISKRK